MERMRIASFEGQGDAREVSLRLDGSDVVICEELSGPSAQIAFGEGRHEHEVRLSPKAVSELVAKIGFADSEGCLWDYLADERYDLTDLVCLCSRQGIPCVVETGESGWGRG